MEDNSIINMNGTSQTQIVEDATTLLTSWLGRLQNLEDRGIREFRAYFMRNKMWIEDIEQLGYYFSSGHESHLYRSFSEKALTRYIIA